MSILNYFIIMFLLSPPVIPDACKINTFSCHLEDTIVFSKIEKIPTHKHLWQYQWNYIIKDGIKDYAAVFINNDQNYKRDIRELDENYFCYSENEKIAFWTLLVGVISYFESNFNPNARMMEPAPLHTWSEGLLQLSYGDEKRYKDLTLDTKLQNILDPNVNLRSGVIILAKQLESKKKIFTKKYYYWSVLTNKKKEIIKLFRANNPNYSTCN